MSARWRRDSMWQHIDSQPGYVSNYSTEWETLRNESCVALRGDGTRCRQDSADGFCAFHYDRLIHWAEGNLVEGLIARARRENPSAMRYVLDEAMIADAQETLTAARAEVYFLAVDDVVKIGFSKNVPARIASLKMSRNAKGKTLAPEGYDIDRAELLGTIPGGMQVERRLHSLLGDHRVIGEWFVLSPLVRQTIDYLLNGGEPPAEIEAFLRGLLEDGAA